MAAMLLLSLYEGEKVPLRDKKISSTTTHSPSYSSSEEASSSVPLPLWLFSPI